MQTHKPVSRSKAHEHSSSISLPFKVSRIPPPLCDPKSNSHFLIGFLCMLDMCRYIGPSTRAYLDLKANILKKIYSLFSRNNLSKKAAYLGMEFFLIFPMPILG